MYHDFENPENCSCDRCQYDRGVRLSSDQKMEIVKRGEHNQAVKNCSEPVGKKLI